LHPKQRRNGLAYEVGNSFAFVRTVADAAEMAWVLNRHGEPIMMLSANTDPELLHWVRWASESSEVPAFMRQVVEAALIACSPDYELLRPVLVELKRRYPEGLHPATRFRLGASA